MAMLPPSGGSTPEPRALPWRLEHDVLVAGTLRVAVQRIGIGHWRPGVRLRSWGVAPLHRTNDMVCAPCDAGEALWLGAWLEDGVGACVRLRDPLTGAGASIALPPDGQLTALEEESQTPQPLTLTASKAHGVLRRLTLELGLELGNAIADLKLVLLAPGEWARCSTRPPPAPLGSPPPLPPRLG